MLGCKGLIPDCFLDPQSYGQTLDDYETENHPQVIW